MAINKCPDCGNPVSDRAKACVRCGCPISEYTERESLKTAADFVKYADKYREEKSIKQHLTTIKERLLQAMPTQKLGQDIFMNMDWEFL